MDRDSKYGQAFRQILQQAGTECVRLVSLTLLVDWIPIRGEISIWS